jgi:type IV secretory pathway VirB4 component
MPKPLGNTQDLVDIKEIRANTVIMKNGALRQIVMVSGINFALKSETEQNIITQAYQNFLNGVDFPLQIIVHSRKVNIERYLEGLAQYSAQEPSPLLQNQAEEYREFIRGFVQKNAIMEKTFLVVVPFYPINVGIPAAQQSAGGFLASLPPFGGGAKKQDSAATEKAKEASDASYAESLSQLTQRVSQVVEGLSQVGLEAVVLNEEQLIELFYNFYNPETVEKQGMNLTGNKVAGS